eukprot:GDKJ01005867.1.p1 GENE.GDKJ01005867.1~~GDKJ01005867.1.p1  ORF type:complete len:249 (-),score=43.31 GDKJ01005867.1:62-787(-)
MKTAQVLPTHSPAPVISTEEELDELYMWVDTIPLSRPKKSIARDFSDGVLAAEVVASFFPKLVDLHNYEAANSVQKKIYNWNTLNQKVLKRLGFQVHPQDIKDVANAKPIAIERILNVFKSLLPEARHNLGDIGKLSSRAETPGHLSSAYGSGSALNNNPPQAPKSGSVVAPIPQSISSQNSPSEKELLDCLLEERDRTIEDLKDTILRLQEKNSRLEQLVKVKDSRIDALMQRLSAADLR